MRTDRRLDVESRGGGTSRRRRCDLGEDVSARDDTRGSRALTVVPTQRELRAQLEGDSNRGELGAELVPGRWRGVEVEAEDRVEVLAGGIDGRVPRLITTCRRTDDGGGGGERLERDRPSHQVELGIVSWEDARDDRGEVGGGDSDG